MIIFLLVLASSEELKLRSINFETVDENFDGFLTHDQFINGLQKAFLDMKLSYTRETINNFGREFLGLMDSDGSVDLKNVAKWVESGEILKEFYEWKDVNGEKEEEAKPLPLMHGTKFEDILATVKLRGKSDL